MFLFTGGDSVKRIISSAVIVALIISLCGCARPMTVCGIKYDSYGLLSAPDDKNDDLKYHVIWGNVFWGVVLFETVIAPLYFFGFSLYEPTGVKRPPKACSV
jgi:hypothetical protein